MKVLGVIPARYASTRFPGKPLANIKGKSMIQRVYEQALKTNLLNHIVVATDDQRIFQHVKSFGGNVLMTRQNHPNGTSRCMESLEYFEAENKYFDVVVNIQGDEPFIQPDQITQVIAPFSNPEVDICSLASPINDTETLFNANVVKVVMNLKGNALYFSRSPIPYIRDSQKEDWIQKHEFYKHLGLYAFRSSVLKKIKTLKPSPLELAENLEQLRWLENGFNIHMDVTHYNGQGIDTPEDLEKLINNSCE